MKLHKILLSLLLASTSTVCLAQNYAYQGKHCPTKPTYKDQMPAPQYVDKFSGFYLGGSLGADSNTFTYRDSLSSTINQGAVTPLGELFAGFGQLFSNRFYLGGEIYANETLGNASSNNTLVDGGGSGTHINIQTRDSEAVSLLPGVLLGQDVVGYGRVGPVWSHYYTAVNSPTSAYTNNNRKLGLELGAGMLVALTYNIDMRLEYSHSMYRSYRTTVNAYHIDPSADRTNLGIVYNFG